MTTTIHNLTQWRARGEKFAMVTAYDALSARIVDDAGIPLILVGDSVSNVMLGYPTTVQVTMDEMLHHARAVARGAREALLVGDLPFGSYQVQGRGDAGERLLAEAQGLAEAGAFSIVLECVPSELGRRVTEQVGLP